MERIKSIPQSIRNAVSSFIKQFPEFLTYIKDSSRQCMSDVWNGYSLFGCDFQDSTIKDLDEIHDILQKIGNSLREIRRFYDSWKFGRKMTIRLLIKFADDLDSARQNNNSWLLAGSTTSLVSSGLGLLLAAPTAGTSLALTVAGVAGGTASAVSGINHMCTDKNIRSQAEECVKKDEERTRNLAEKQKALERHIGRLGKWLDSTHKNTINFATVHDIARTCTPAMATCLSTVTAVEEGSEAVVRNGAKHLFVISIILDSATIAFVVADLLNGSKTKTGEHFRKLASELEGELIKMEKIYDNIKREGRLLEDAENVRRAAEVVIAQKDAEIARKDAENARKDTEIAQKDAEIEVAWMAAEVCRKDTEIARKDAEIAHKEAEHAKLKLEMVLKDDNINHQKVELAYKDTIIAELRIENSQLNQQITSVFTEK